MARTGLTDNPPYRPHFYPPQATGGNWKMDIKRKAEIRQAAASYDPRNPSGPRKPKIIATPAEVLELVDDCDSLRLMLDQLGEAGAILTAYAGGADVEVPDLQFSAANGTFRTYPIAAALKKLRGLERSSGG